MRVKVAKVKYFHIGARIFVRCDQRIHPNERLELQRKDVIPHWRTNTAPLEKLNVQGVKVFLGNYNFCNNFGHITLIVKHI